MMTTRAPRSQRTIDPAKGLHRLKADFQKKYMAEQCRELTAQLDVAIEATRLAAPVRTRPYLPDRRGKASRPVGKEAAIERALHQQWSGPQCRPVPGCWHAIVEFQVNLPARRVAGDGWGEIDLLGVAEDGLPIVIEVKADQSTETPAQLLVQAAAYGVALQKAWNTPRSDADSRTFRLEWQQAVVEPRFGKTKAIPKELSPCHLVCVAPEKYWREWRSLSHLALERLSELMGALRGHGLPATFVTLQTTYQPTVFEVASLGQAR